MKLKRLQKGEKGFTLIELVIAIAITGLIGAGITTAILQTFNLSSRTTNHMAAVREVQEAGYWVSLYAYTASDIEITGDSGFPLVLRWVDFETYEKNEIVFSLDSSGLRGSWKVDDVFDSEKTGQIPVLEFVDPDETNCKMGGGSAFSLPDDGDAFNITGEATPDGGIIVVRGGNALVSADGAATCNQIQTDPYDIYAWNTTSIDGSITVTATDANTTGSWTSETQADAAAITVDIGATSATLSAGRVLIFTVTATVGTGRHEATESRVYEVLSKPAS